MYNQEPDSQLLTRLSEIESSLSERLSRLEKSLEETRKSLEETRLLMADLHRYGRLQALLAEGKWKEADCETTKAMLEVAGHTSQETLTPEILQTFPCNAIRVIDELWRKHSSDRFGFSIQLQLYQSLGGNIDTLRAQDTEMLQRMGDRIGARQKKKWLEYDELNFSLEAPVGALPANWWDSPYGAKMINFFLMRLLSCNL